MARRLVQAAASSSRAKPWELYPPTAAGYAPAGGEDRDLGGWEEDVDEEEVLPSQAGDHLAELLIQLRLKGVISAKQCCVLAHWASLAGAVGPCDKFAMKPGHQSGAYQRKLDSYLEIDKNEPFYMLKVPGMSPELGERVVHDVEVLPPHEILASEVEKDPGFLARVAAGAGQEEWPQLAGHPAVLAAGPGEVVVPLALYVDGVPYTKADSFLAFWLYDLVTYKRHLVCVLRKSRICACGCKKWCSLWEIFRWLHWSFRALALGAHPAERHDGRPWELVDHVRASAAGTPLVRGALVLLKGDWAEFCLSFGFPTWSSTKDPCMFCCSPKSQLSKIAGLSAFSFPHALKTNVGYADACEAAEKWVVLTREEHASIVPHLSYDKRKDAPKDNKLRNLSFPPQPHFAVTPWRRNFQGKKCSVSPSISSL